MLAHQIHTSEGSIGAAVKLTSRTVANFDPIGPCASGVSFDIDGVLSEIQAGGGLSAIIGEWLLTGAASAFFIQRTIITGTLEEDPGTGFLAMSSIRRYENNKASDGLKVTEVFFEISSDVSGVPIVATATHVFSSIVNAI